MSNLLSEKIRNIFVDNGYSISSALYLHNTIIYYTDSYVFQYVQNIIKYEAQKENVKVLFCII